MNLAKQIKKLIFSNQFTFDDITKITGESLEDCVEAYESYYNSPIPPSLLIVGNEKARAELKKQIKSAVPVLVCGKNGVGKDVSLKKISEELGLTLRKTSVLSQEELIKAFGKAPFVESNFLFVVNVDSLNKKKYAVLKSFVVGAKSPLVLTAVSRNSVNKRILSELKVVTMTEPSPVEVERFLKEKYAWNGNIADVYDPDMRVVLSRVINEIDFNYKEVPKEPIRSDVLAFKTSCGFSNFDDFDLCEEPLWWTIRWLAYNQDRKFPRDKKSQLENLRKLSEIDARKFLSEKKYLRGMVLGLKTSQNRSRFSFPPWPKKITEKEEEVVEKLKKTVAKEKEKIEKKTKQVNFSKWL